MLGGVVCIVNDSVLSPVFYLVSGSNSPALGTTRLLREGNGYTRGVCICRLVCGFRNTKRFRTFCVSEEILWEARTRRIHALGARRHARIPIRSPERRTAD